MNIYKEHLEHYDYHLMWFTLEINIKAIYYSIFDEAYFPQAFCYPTHTDASMLYFMWHSDWLSGFFTALTSV